MSFVQARSKTIVLIVAVAQNNVIGKSGKMPWHLPADLDHFKDSTLSQTVLMGRTTFESIGRPLPGRESIVLTRDDTWRQSGVHIAHDLQSAIDMAEDLPGSLMVVGGSHIYAATISLAQMQVISEVDGCPVGDAYYPDWDRSEWQLGEVEEFEGFSVSHWHRRPREDRYYRFDLDDESARLWWSDDWHGRLAKAVAAQQRRTADSAPVNWDAVHQSAMQVIVQAAEDFARQGSRSSPQTARQVRLNRHLSLADLHAIQGALFHWSDYLAPRRLSG